MSGKLTVAILMLASSAFGQSWLSDHHAVLIKHDQAATNAPALPAWKPPQADYLLFWIPCTDDGTTDTLGAGHDLVYGTGGAAPTYDSANKHIAFGGNDWAEIGTSTSLFNNETTCSFSYWCRQRAGATMTWIGDGAGSFSAQSFSSYEYRMLREGGASGDTSTPAANNVWHHVAVVANGANNYVYYNGTLEVTYSRNNTITVSAKSLLGCNTKTTQFVTGDMKQIGGWSVALSSNEVYNLWNDTK